MDSLHILFITTAVLLQIFGYTGYRKEKLTLDLYLNKITMLSIFFFIFGVIPLQMEDVSIFRQLFISIVITVACYINLKIIMKMINSKRNSPMK